MPGCRLQAGCRRSGGSEEGWESACKPGSVGDSHSSGTHVAVRLERPTREHARAARRRLICKLPYLVLLRVGFTLPLPLPPARCALTAPFHPYLPPYWAGSAVSFLWHFPWTRAPQALPGTLPCGARTFLPRRERRARLSGRLPTSEYSANPILGSASIAGDSETHPSSPSADASSAPRPNARSRPRR